MSVIPASQIRTGMVIIYENEPYKVLSFRYSMQGRGSNTIPCKLRSLISGAAAEPRFRSDDKIERAFIEEKEMEYLYEDGDEFWFMNPDDFEQFSLQKDELEEVRGYILPNMRVQIQFYEGKAIGVTPPNTVQLKVVETEPSIKGATASGNVTKPATLETGIIVQVPMFIERDDVLIINTQTGEYQGRPGKG